MFAEWASDNDGGTCSFGEQQQLIGSVSVCKLISMDVHLVSLTNYDLRQYHRVVVKDVLD
jgi:hypothetical protein